MTSVTLLSLTLALQVPGAEINAYLKHEMETWRVPGASVAVVHDGRLVFEQGYGLANVELGVPADGSTVYELLSVSKQLTATAVMLLVEDEALSLDQRVVAVLDGLPASWKDVTIAQLLSHTSGIPDYVDQPGWSGTLRDERAPRDLLATVESRPLLFAPGSAWRYSNSNYYVLGLVIEERSGRRFDEFVAARILEPLDMRATRLESYEAIVPRRSAGYHASRAAVLNAPWIDPSHKWAAGAFVSSVDDLAKWAIALDERKLLRPASHERMLAPAELADGTLAPYGFANELDQDHGHRVAGHQGGGMAFNATLLRYVDDRLSVVVLCNLTQAPSKAWARHIASFWIPDLVDAAAQAIEDPDPAFSAIFRGVLIDAAQGKADGELFAPDVREKLETFLERVGPQFLGPRGKLLELTALEVEEHEATIRRRYRAQFERGTILWTVELDQTGKIVSLEPDG